MILDNRLRTFLAVARGGSFSQAAYRLSLSQSAVSSQIGALEKELGVLLFQRKGRTISLTSEGVILLREGEEIERQALRLEEIFSSHSDAIEKRIRLGSDAITCIFTLPPTIAAFKAEHPEVVFSYEHRPQEAILEGVLNDRLDLAMVGHPLRDRRLTVTDCFSDEIVLVASTNRQEPEGAIDAEVLTHLPLILVSSDVGLELLVRRELERVGVPMKELSIFLEVDELAIAKSFVEADLGVAFLPRVTVANEIRLGLFREIEVNGLQLIRQNLMIYRKNVEPIEIVAAFREFVKRREWN